ncbi:hypothetical protein PF001_g22557 [Phytophthora fragariae]|uniref:Endonuclease/exonuclease/phosphatase domain-containing protein n=1 Tax=Phytophthora fragariae TaxID=53985 RepID=A0A6A4C232_9STRA|nr:hypothetical protein PF011_g24315 [Phytophthora fragariae]KAE9080565.1 hypothetical protein PF006_g27290 [Phytophthora fragariae]KAE9284079.1 hypothetical protein PF001_g22557 [Phytophthora fragariae]
MEIQLDNTLLVNLCAPNDRTDREEFFTELAQREWSKGDIIMAGDFNSVQCPILDRLGGRRSGRPESAALQDLVQQLYLEDASTLAAAIKGDEEESDPIEVFTYWGPEAASRIDRFYVPQAWAGAVQWVEVAEPAASSDHQRV